MRKTDEYPHLGLLVRNVTNIFHASRGRREGGREGGREGRMRERTHRGIMLT